MEVTKTTKIKGVGPAKPLLQVRELEKVRKWFIGLTLVAMVALGFITMAIATPKWSSLQNTDKVDEDQRMYMNFGLFQYTYGCMFESCQSNKNRNILLSKTPCEQNKLNVLKATNHPINTDHHDECEYNHMGSKTRCLCPQFEYSEIDSVYGQGSICPSVADEDKYGDNDKAYAKELRRYQLWARVLTCACAAFTFLVVLLGLAGVGGYLFGYPAAALGFIGLAIGVAGCWLGVDVGRMYGWAAYCGSGDKAKAEVETTRTELDWFSLSPILMTTGLVVLFVAVILAAMIGRMHQGWIVKNEEDPRDNFEHSTEFQNHELN